MNFFQCPLYSLQATSLQRQSLIRVLVNLACPENAYTFFTPFLHILLNKLKYQNICGQGPKIFFHSITDTETNTANRSASFCRQNIGIKPILLVYHFLTTLKCPEKAEFHQLQWKWKWQTGISQKQAHPSICCKLNQPLDPFRMGFFYNPF